MYLTNGAPTAELAHHLEERRTTDAGRFTEHERLGHQLRQPRDHRVDRELHDPSLLSLPDMMDGRTDRPDQRFDFVERLTRAGDDEAQVAGAYDARVAADGRAEVRHGRRVRQRRHPCRGGRRDGAQVDEDGSRPRRVDDARRDRLECLVVRERGEDHIHLLCELRQRLRDHRAPTLQSLRLLGRPVVHHERVTGVENAARDRSAHVAETDQPHGDTRVLRGTHCPV